MSRQVEVGNIKIGGTAPVSIQSMTNVHPHDSEGIFKTDERPDKGRM